MTTHWTASAMQCSVLLSPTRAMALIDQTSLKQILDALSKTSVRTTGLPAVKTVSLATDYCKVCPGANQDCKTCASHEFVFLPLHRQVFCSISTRVEHSHAKSKLTWFRSNSRTDNNSCPCTTTPKPRAWLCTRCNQPSKSRALCKE